MLSCYPISRRGKKTLKGKKSRKGEDESADTSSSVMHDEAQPGTRMKPKQKKKLLKEVSISGSFWPQFLPRAVKEDTLGHQVLQLF